MSDKSTADRVLEALAKYDLKSEGEGKYRSNSPLYPGSNSHGFSVLIRGPEHGAYNDFAHNDQGSLYDLARRLDIALPETVDVQDTKRGYKDLAEYAEAHGVSAEVFLAARWSEVQQHQGRPALAFQTQTGTRWRFIDGKTGRDFPPYKSPMDYKACWYGLARALKLAEETWKPLVICNGEASTVVAQHYQLPATCITGSSERTLPTDLFDALQKAYPEGQILIALDCDTKGHKAAQAILAQFRDAKREGVRAVDLKLGNKGDLADYCMLFGGDSDMTGLPDLPAPSEEPLDTESLVAALEKLNATMRLDAKLRKQQDVNLLCTQVQANLDKIQGAYAAPTVTSFAELATSNIADLERLMANPDPIQGLRSRIESIDKAVGGFSPEVYVIYGATSAGKSWLVVSLVREFITQAPGLIATTESSPKRWINRLVATLTGIAVEKIETGQIQSDEFRKIKSTYDMLHDLKCHTLAEGQPTPSQLRAAFLDGQAKYGYAWLIIDSASKMNAPGTAGIYDRTVVVSDGIQNLMTEANVPIIATNQVGRDVSRRKNKQPQLEDAYGGGVIEHNAGIVLALYRHDYYVQKGLAEIDPMYPAGVTVVRLLKHRWRDIVDTNGIKLTFAGGHGFHELQSEIKPVSHYLGDL